MHPISPALIMEYRRRNNLSRETLSQSGSSSFGVILLLLTLSLSLSFALAWSHGFIGETVSRVCDEYAVEQRARTHVHAGMRVTQCRQGFQLMNDASINTANNKKLRLRWSQYNNYISISANKNQQPSSACCYGPGARD